MIDHQVAGIKTYLANASLHASPDWVEGCVEFFVSEYHDQGYTGTSLQEFVLQQWKLADLREMGQGCLPPNLSSTLMIVLPGKYALQVEQIKNVGQSAYTQLQKIYEQVSGKVEVDATFPQAWESHPTRMLQLELCDGIQNIKGIEYRPISLLNEQLLPGCKVLVVGPVECRKGVLLLQQHNLEILGGEIDSLLVSNATENVLARILNLPLNPDPYRTQTDVNMSPQITLQRKSVLSGDGFEQLPIQQNSAGSSWMQEIVAPIQNVEHKSSSSRNSINQVPKRNSEKRIEDELLCEDDLILEAEMDAHLSVLECEYQKEVVKSQISYDISETEQKFLGDLQREWREEGSELLQHHQVPTHLEITSSSSQSELTGHHNTTHLLNDDDDDILLQMSLEALENPKMQNTLSVSSRLTSVQDSHTEHHVKSVSLGLCTSMVPSHTMRSKVQNVTTESKINLFLNKNVIETCDSKEVPGSSSNTSEDDKAAQLACLKQYGVLLKYKEVLPDLTSNSTHDFNEKLKTEPDLKLIQTHGSEISMKTAVRNEDATKTPVVIDSNPFVYLSQVKVPVKGRTVFRVKAFVMTLLSQMMFGKDGWQLLVKLCDGSRNLDARLSSNVLEKLIGFSTAEVLAMRQEMRNNPLLKEKLKNIIQNAQQQLTELNCLLDIEFVPDSEMPSVIELTEITEQHLQALQARVKVVGTSLT